MYVCMYAAYRLRLVIFYGHLSRSSSVVLQVKNAPPPYCTTVGQVKGAESKERKGPNQERISNSRKQVRTGMFDRYIISNRK